MKLTDRLTGALLKNDVYHNYLLLCLKLDETPRLDILTMIKGCNEFKALKETINIFESKL